jgi:hypothetical protein
MPSKKEIATTVLTLGLSWLWKRHIAKAVAKRLPKWVDDAATDMPLPPKVKEALDAVVQARVDIALEQLGATSERIKAKLAKPTPKLLADMAAKREAAIKAGKAKIPPRGRK